MSSGFETGDGLYAMVLAAAFLRDEEGATAIEYALMVSLIALAIIAAVTLVGTGLTTKFTSVNTAVSAAGGGG